MIYLRQHPKRPALFSLCFVLWGSLALVGIAGRQRTPGQQAAGASPTVEVTRFVPAISQGKLRLFRLSFKYDFPGRTRVVVVGFGEVPAKGSLSYLTPDRSLIFKDKDGAILKLIQLKITGTPEGANSKMPAPGDFPPEIKSYTRDGVLSREHCDAVLNDFFDSGYVPDDGPNVTVYTTTYQNISNPPDGKVVRYALRITSPFPLPDNPGQSSFHVQLAVQERGILSPNPAQETSDDAVKAAERLRDQIVGRLLQ
jgi:hypothetical protein